LRGRLREAAPDGAAQSGDPLLDAVRRDVREVEAHRVVAAPIRVERLARHERDVLFERLGEQLARIDRRRHLGPDAEAALCSGPGAALWEVLFQRPNHHVATLAVDIPDLLDVLLQEPAVVAAADL